jgi:peptide/nickel transport system substrate-binding protein
MSTVRRGSTRLTRRTLMGTALAGTAAVAAPYRGRNILAAPLRSFQEGEPKRGGTLIVGADVSPVGLDPALTTAFASVAIYEHMYSSLLTLDYATNMVKPDLAESWSTVDDRTVEFKLRQGVKFRSGREVTAEDVKYTIDRLMDESIAVPLRS